MLFQVNIHDPDNGKVVHTLAHLVEATGRVEAIIDVARSYGFPKHGWRLAAIPYLKPQAAVAAG